MIIEFNNVKALAHPENERDQAAYTHVRRKLKTKAPGVEYTKSHILYKKTKGRQGWDGLVNILEPNYTFPTGLLPEVVRLLWKETQTLPILEDKRNKSNNILYKPQVNLRKYQKESIVKGFKNYFNKMWWPRGVYKTPTGGGKTELAVAIYEINPVPTLFVVHLKTLGYQASERFEKYGHTPSRLFDGAASFPNPNLAVATIHSIMRNKENSTVASLLKNTQQIFFDEAHLVAAKSAKGNWFSTLSTMAPKAFFRWGLTATPFMKDIYSNRLLEAATGQILDEISSKELVDLGFLAPAKIFIIDVPKIHKCPKKWPECYDAGIILNMARTRLTVEQLKEHNPPAFVLTNQISHARILKDAIQRSGLNVSIITGANKQKERQRELDKLDSGALDVIVCTTVFDEGLDFPGLKTIVMAGGGKSEVKTIQRVGRGMRKRKGKTQISVIDFMDNSSRILKNQSNERIKIYKEQEFEFQT